MQIRYLKSGICNRPHQYYSLKHWKVLLFICVVVLSMLTCLSFLFDRKYKPALCYNSKGKPLKKDCFGGWFYYPKTAEKNAEFAKAHHWNYVLFSSSVKTEEDRERLISNVLAFRKQNIAVHLMCLESTSYIDNPISAYKEIAGILKFVNEHNLDIQGIHTDCEPHAREDWKKASPEEKNKIFENYLKVIEYGRKAINELRPKTAYSGAVAWWYARLSMNNELQNGRGYDLVNEERFDFIMPMIYDGAGGSVEDLVDKSRDYIMDGAATVIGIAVNDYDYGKFYEVINKIKQIRCESSNSDYFNGFSVFANILYPDWEDY